MNTQFKKGALELCVLSQLVGGDKYGYELTEKISGEMHGQTREAGIRSAGGRSVRCGTDKSRGGYVRGSRGNLSGPWGLAAFR